MSGFTSARILGAALMVTLAGTRGFAQAPAVVKPPTRSMAVTFDDLPAVSVVKGDPASLLAFTDRLLAVFSRFHIPIVGFVNEGKLSVRGEGLDGQRSRIELLQRWIAAGLELGNHTYSHRSLNDLPIEEFEADVVRGEAVTAALLSTQGRGLRYFRHPFLQVGLDLDKRRAFEAWLKGRGYTIAPVTVDNDERFAGVTRHSRKEPPPPTSRTWRRCSSSSRV